MKKLILVALFMLGVATAKAAEVGYIVDTRDFNMFEVITSGQVAKGLNFWGFTDIYSQQQTTHQADLSDYFMEYRLNYNLFYTEHRSLDFFYRNQLFIEAEYNGFSGPSNDLVRLGFTYQRNFYDGGWISFRYFPWDTRPGFHEHYSITHTFPLVNKFSFFGFYDYHRSHGVKNVWYTEPSLIYEFNKTYSAILIWRYDGFLEDVPGERTTGLAAGIYMKL